MSKKDRKKVVDEVLDAVDLELDEDAERDWFERELKKQEEEMERKSQNGNS